MATLLEELRERTRNASRQRAAALSAQREIEKREKEREMASFRESITTRIVNVLANLNDTLRQAADKELHRAVVFTYYAKFPGAAYESDLDTDPHAKAVKEILEYKAEYIREILSLTSKVECDVKHCDPDSDGGYPNYSILTLNLVVSWA